MYIHPVNRWENEEEIISFIKQNSFATLVSTVDGKPWATHLPFFLSTNENGEYILSGHIAKPNKQWKFLSEEDVLVIFQGPHAYISSSWYNHENVPTWNYLAVHVYGKIRTIEGDELMEHLKSLVDTFEEGRPNRVSVEGMSEGYLNSQLKGLVGIEININEVHASAKLSQNRDKINYQNIIDHLKESPYSSDRDVANEMNKRKQE